MENLIICNVLKNKFTNVFLFEWRAGVLDGLQDPSRSTSLFFGVQLLLYVLRRTLPAYGPSCGLPLWKLYHEMVPSDRMGIASRRQSHLRWRQASIPEETNQWVITKIFIWTCLFATYFSTIPKPTIPNPWQQLRWI